MIRLFPLLLLFLCATELAAREEYRYDLLMAGLPSGEVVDIWEKISTGGQCVVRVTSDMQVMMGRGGFDMKMRTRTVAEADCGTYRPRSLTVERDEGGGPVVTKAQRVGDKLVAATVKNGVTEKHEVDLDADTVFFGMLFRKYPNDFFQKKGAVNALSEEGLTVRKIDFNGRRDGDRTVIDMVYEGVPISFTVRGPVVTATVMNGGLISYILRGEKAPRTAASKGTGDMLAATAIANGGITVKQPRRVTRLVMLVEQAPAAIPGNCPQRVETSGEDATTVTVDTSRSPCPGTPAAADTAATIYEDKDNLSVLATAVQWKGIADKRQLARKVIAFVYEHISDKNYRHGTLSASETLKAKAGDCTEHSALAAALLKALKVPVKNAYGLVLSEEGKFFFHNWIEVHTGDGWIPADPTFAQFPADAARLTIARSGGGGAREREDLSLTVLKFLQGTRIAVTGFSHE